MTDNNNKTPPDNNTDNNIATTTTKKGKRHKLALYPEHPNPHHPGSRLNGNPTKYRPDMPDIAAQLILQGHMEKDAAKLMGLSVASWCDYKYIYPEFAEAIGKAKKAAIPALIEPALLKAAQGFHFEETDTFTRDGNSIIHKRFALPNVKAQLAALARYDPEYRQSQQSSLSVAIGANLNMRFMSSGDPGPGVIEGQVEGETETVLKQSQKCLPGKPHE